MTWNSMDMNLGELWEIGTERGRVCCSPWGLKKSETTQQMNNKPNFTQVQTLFSVPVPSLVIHILLSACLQTAKLQPYLQAVSLQFFLHTTASYVLFNQKLNKLLPYEKPLGLDEKRYAVYQKEINLGYIFSAFFKFNS